MRSAATSKRISVANNATVDMLIAYQQAATATTPQEIDIADVTIVNTSGHTIHDTGDFAFTATTPTATLTVTDLVHIPTILGLANLVPADIHFIA